ncbi:unnamed protein product [Adineta steineri]|uniref:Uncharacterized protein n=1 Tax=Adineta steineri TaxID=433720 RepID=A0A814VH20_9BILA|nr:unnamed protein product [Adineta steineri]CAF3965150.1 unnamed protein product [Adineta steineri]
MALSLFPINISLGVVQEVQPQNCVCYDPGHIDTNNSTVACNTTHCSRGNNPNCNVAYPDYTIIHLRAFGYYGAIVTSLGCNCPGYNYSNSSDENAMDGASNGGYSYTDCDGFGGDEHDDDVIYCCKYCCGLLPVYTTTSVPTATSSTHNFPIYILFSLAFILIKMIAIDSADSSGIISC